MNKRYSTPYHSADNGGVERIFLLDGPVSSLLAIPEEESQPLEEASAEDQVGVPAIRT